MTVNREQVLTAAAELLTRRANASMDEIAKAAGISRATLHRHFAGRDALVRALALHGIERVEKGLAAARIEEGSPQEAVRRLIGRAMPAAGFLLFLRADTPFRQQDRTGDGWQRIDARVSDLFRRGQQEGAFRIDLSPRWLTEALYALIAASARTAQDGRTAPRDAPQMVAELLLGGACREPAAAAPS